MREDLRPMLAHATIIAPGAESDLTVVLRVTYRTIEELCAAEDAPETLDRNQAVATVRARFARSSSAS